MRTMTDTNQRVIIAKRQKKTDERPAIKSSEWSIFFLCWTTNLIVLRNELYRWKFTLRFYVCHFPNWEYSSFFLLLQISEYRWKTKTTQNNHNEYSIKMPFVPAVRVYYIFNFESYESVKCATTTPTSQNRFGSACKT